VGRRFTRWDEPITVEAGGGEAYIYAFGVAVILGYTASPPQEELLEKLRRAAEPPGHAAYVEEYAWDPRPPPPSARGRRVRLPAGTVVVGDDLIRGPLDREARRILALVLAQSAALRRLEAEASSLLDEVEDLLERLAATRIPRATARQSLVRALRARNTLVNDLLILEKPPAAWEDPHYESLLETLRYTFEIEERYTTLSRMLNTALETIEITATLATETRFLILEALIAALIIIDTILALRHP